MKPLSHSLNRVIATVKHTESPIEVQLFRQLMATPPYVLCEEDVQPVGEGLFIFPQRQVGKYRADFIIQGVGYIAMNRVWPPKLRATMAVECDGREYHSSAEQLAHDKARDEYFLSLGIKTLRFKGEEINRNVKFCVDQITHFMDLEMKRNWDVQG